MLWASLRLIDQNQSLIQEHKDVKTFHKFCPKKHDYFPIYVHDWSNVPDNPTQVGGWFATTHGLSSTLLSMAIQSRGIQSRSL